MSYDTYRHASSWERCFAQQRPVASFVVGGRPNPQSLLLAISGSPSPPRSPPTPSPTSTAATLANTVRRLMHLTVHQSGHGLARVGILEKDLWPKWSSWGKVNSRHAHTEAAPAATCAPVSYDPSLRCSTLHAGRSRPPPHSTAVLSYAHAETESISSSNREQLSRTSGRPCVADRHICTSPADNALSPTRPLACALPDQLGNAIGAFKVQANQSTGTASLDELLRYSDWGEGGIGMDVRMEVGIER